MHILCTICSDLINQAESIFGTNCGHIFHHHCLSQWIERSKTCPQCRNKVTEKCMFRMYPTISSDKTDEDATTLQARLDDVQLQLREQKNAYKLLNKKVSVLNEDLKKQEELVQVSEKRLVSRESAVSALKKQLEYLKVQNKETERLREENEELTKNMQTLKGLEVVLNACSAEVEEMIAGYSDLRTLATFATALKRALCESEEKKKESRGRAAAARSQLAAERADRARLAARLAKLESKYSEIKNKYEAFQNDLMQNEMKLVEMMKEAQEKNAANETERASEPTGEEGGEAKGEAAPRRKRTRSRLDSSDASLLDNTTSSMEGQGEYLSLRSGNLALAALRRTDHARLKPTEYTLMRSAPGGAPVRNPGVQHSIFAGSRRAGGGSGAGLAPDGLGGRARPAPAPGPGPGPAPRPAPGPRHRLRRPPSTLHQLNTTKIDAWLK